MFFNALNVIREKLCYLVLKGSVSEVNKYSEVQTKNVMTFAIKSNKSKLKKL